MGEKKTVNGAGGGIAAGIAIAAVSALPHIKPLLDIAVKIVDEEFEKRKRMISVPELYSKEFPLTVEQAVEMLDRCNLKAIIINASLNDADPRFRDCVVNQIIDSHPKAKQKVDSGASVSIKCITQEVIDESKKLYEESVARKIEVKARRSERIEQSKTMISETKDKIKKLPKKRKNSEQQ